MGKIIGIDLGTTNSCVAHMLGDKYEIIANAEWNRTTPSIVYIKGDELLVWDLAKRKAILEPKNVIFEVKRFIGMKYDEVKDICKTMPYETKKGKDGGVLIVVDGKEYKPEQISAFVLQKLKEDAEKYLGTTITQAVITVPAYFNDSQRNATKAAGEIAGLKVERIINEPTAASLCYGTKSKDEKVLVYDLGWGTFDVTILEIGSEGTFQVLATSGDTHLGWADFDAKIIAELLADFKKKENIDLSTNAMAMQRIKDEAENAKKQLSQTEKVDIMIPFITVASDGTPRNLEFSLTRAHFEKICDDLIKKCKTPVKQAIDDAKIDADEIDEVLLVGGSTRMPWVKGTIKDILGKDAKATVNPDEAVAAGAAVQAGIIQGDVKDILLLDVTPLSLAVEVEGGIANVMIPRNTTIPVKKTQIYTTAVDGQPAVTVHVTQGERKFARDNKSLGQFNLEGIPSNMRRGEPQIEVTFDIDANGILHVSAKEKSTGVEQKVTIQGATGLSDEEIAKAREEAEKFAEEDRKRAEIVEAKNTLESTINQVEKMIEENADKIPQDQKDSIKAVLDDAKKVKDDADSSANDLRAQTEKVQKTIQDLAGSMKRQSWAAPSGQTSNDGPIDGEVIEG